MRAITAEHAGIRRSFTMVMLAAALGGAAIVSGGCATTEEWGIWREHSSHFASGRHLGFSFRNQGDRAPRVHRDDLASASIESWWGKPITVAQEQILER